MNERDKDEMQPRRMDVREIFALRREGGRAEEAYRAISALYAEHQGPHTTLCMFWCTNDLLRQRIRERNVPEARRLLGQLVKLDSLVKDERGRTTRAISRAALEMDKLVPNFNLFYFILWFRTLDNEDWLPKRVDGRRIPSLGQQIVNRLMRDIVHREPVYIEHVTELFRIALQRQPLDRENLRNLAQMYAALGQKDKAFRIYKNLLSRYADSYLHSEMAALTDDATAKTALLCRAVANQPREERRAKYHLELAGLLADLNYTRRAAYELAQCVAIYQRMGRTLSPDIKRLQQRLAGVQPVTAKEEQVLYDRAKTYVTGLTGPFTSHRIRGRQQ